MALLGFGVIYTMVPFDTLKEWTSWRDRIVNFASTFLCVGLKNFVGTAGAEYYVWAYRSIWLTSTSLGLRVVYRMSSGCTPNCWARGRIDFSNLVALAFAG